MVDAPLERLRALSDEIDAMIRLPGGIGQERLVARYQELAADFDREAFVMALAFAAVSLRLRLDGTRTGP